MPRFLVARDQVKQFDDAVEEVVGILPAACDSGRGPLAPYDFVSEG